MEDDAIVFDDWERVMNCDITRHGKSEQRFMPEGNTERRALLRASASSVVSLRRFYFASIRIRSPFMPSCLLWGQPNQDMKLSRPLPSSSLMITAMPRFPPGTGLKGASRGGIGVSTNDKSHQGRGVRPLTMIDGRPQAHPLRMAFATSEDPHPSGHSTAALACATQLGVRFPAWPRESARRNVPVARRSRP